MMRDRPRRLDDLRQDLRLAVRTLGRSPGFAAAAVAVLAFGIGLAVAMFTVFDAVLRRPLPMHDQKRVVALWLTAEGQPRRVPLGLDQFEAMRRESRTLDGVAGTISDRAWPIPVRTDDDGVLSLNIAQVTGDFFHVLGASPALGRTLRPEDDVPGAEPVAVIAHGFWRRHFGGDPDAIGSRLTVPERELTYTIVGVAPPGLEYPAAADFWVPLLPYYTPPGGDAPAPPHVEPVGRLARGATHDEAAAEVLAFAERDAPPALRDYRLRGHARALPELVTGDVRPALLVLTAAAALLLLIACVNVATLLLVRATGRREEIAVRRALGARRARILRQLLTESAVLALAGGAMGALLATGLVNGLLALTPPDLPRLEEIRMGGVPLAIAAGVTAAAVLVFGVAPAVWSSGDVGSPLRAAGRAGTASVATRRARHALVALQVGLGLVVLAAAGLLGRTLLHLERLDMGFAAERVVMVRLAAPWARIDGPAGWNARLYDRIVPALEAAPGIASVSPVNAMPFAGATAGGWDGGFIAEDGDGQVRLLNMEVVGPEFFRTLGVPLVRGRGFTAADRDDAPRVAVVNHAAARIFWPGEDPIGKRLGLGRPSGPGEGWTVVGLAQDARYRALREPRPTVYLPHRQLGAPVTVLAVRASGDAATTVAAIRHAVERAEADVVVAAVPMDRLVAGQLAQPRLSAFLLAVFGAGGLLLATTGLYAVLAYLVRQRARELAIRVALGATPARLRLLVIRQAAVLTGAGVAFGLAAALAGGGLLGSVLYGVAPSDPATLAGAAAVLLAAALAAAYVPARRATRADPAAALREE